MRTVAVEGVIGVGKSTLCSAISDSDIEHRVHVTQESDVVGEHMLRAFYGNPKRYALAFQLSTFQKRWFKWQLAQQTQNDANGDVYVLDRSIFGDHVFASANFIQGNMTREDYALYREEFAQFLRLRNGNSNGDVAVVVLDALPYTTQMRIAMRGNKSESGIPLEYLRLLYFCYFNMTMCLVECGYNVHVYDWEALENVPDACAVMLDVSQLNNVARATFVQRSESKGGGDNALVPREIAVISKTCALKRSTETLRFMPRTLYQARATMLELARERAVRVEYSSTVANWFGNTKSNQQPEFVVNGRKYES